jgi:PepSY-associated TM region
MKAWLLKFHRWMAILFAIPLAVLIVTGLILSLNPILFDRGVTGRSLALSDVEAALAKFDPDKRATTLNIRAYEGVVLLSAGRGSAPQRIDLASKTEIPATKSLWSETLTAAQRLHETFQDLGYKGDAGSSPWMQALIAPIKYPVAASTYAMLVFMALGILMGWGNFRNSLGGWHRMTAWVLLPLLILSPLTGLALFHRITFTPLPQRPADPPATLHDAVKLIAAKHDLATVMWIRPLGPNLGARLYDNGRASVFMVTKTGLVATPTPWPRLLHEGTWAGKWSGIVNIVTSLAFVLLLVTGLTIWVRRRMRRATRVRT